MVSTRAQMFHLSGEEMQQITHTNHFQLEVSPHCTPRTEPSCRRWWERRKPGSHEPSQQLRCSHRIIPASFHTNGTQYWDTKVKPNRNTLKKQAVFENSLFWVRILPGDSSLTYVMCIREVRSEMIHKVCCLLFALLGSTSVITQVIHSLVWVTTAASYHHPVIAQLSPEETKAAKIPETQTVHCGTFYSPVKEISHRGNRAEQIPKHHLTKQSEDLWLLTQPKGHIGRPWKLKTSYFKYIRVLPVLPDNNNKQPRPRHKSLCKV